MVVTKNLKAGSHIITFSAPGYDTMRAEILVSSSGVTCIKVDGGGSCGSTTPPGVNMIGVWSVFGTLRVTDILPPTRGYLSVTSTPSNASVDVNGTDIGKTPITSHELTVGSKLVTLRLSGYTPEERSVTIVQGKTASIDVPLSAIATEEEGFLSVTSVPTGASVSIGGVSIGSTPITAYGLPAGTKVVSVSLEGYETATQSVTVVAGETLDMGTITLTESVVPTGICGWIDSVGVDSLTRDHWLYVYYITKGGIAESVIEDLFNSLIPKPGRHITPEEATQSNWVGLYRYSQGARSSGNEQTGCSY